MAKKTLFDKILKQLSTAESKSLLGIFCLLAVIGFIWIKIEQAKRRDEERRGRGNIGGNNNRRPRVYNHRNNDEIRRIKAKQRYLENRNWENQCICLCLEQLINHNISNGLNIVSFKNEFIINLLKNLAKKHRLYIIHLLPSDVQSKLNNDKPYEQSKYEIDIINLFDKSGIIESGLPRHKILFCTTKKGKSSMVRQLMPTLYMDSDEFVLKELYQHLTEVVQITPLLGAGGIAPTVFVSNSVQSYFS